MNRQRSYKMNPSVAATAMLVLLIVICLTEGASGSCLSYGHSCWGAHGKRSGRQSSSAADLYLNRILSRMASNDMTRGKTYDLKNDDFDDIFRVVVEDPSNRLTSESEEPVVDMSSKLPEAKPMLDDDLISKMKLWQLMRVASQEQ
ncbi:unnamed protein product [Leptidea sinapis]|uniref:CCHamide-1 n=1 Tax=Leptidea sinapis TaxID=189913 RepID=A0A5E4Q9M1_9NEOP|nr:unnamed protein product [Leptidea sinapis]